MELHFIAVFLHLLNTLHHLQI